jgi:hypothetical protein
MDIEKIAAELVVYVVNNGFTTQSIEAVKAALAEALAAKPPKG